MMDEKSIAGKKACFKNPPPFWKDEGGIVKDERQHNTSHESWKFF
jgi:hypothetical protein